MTTKIRLTFWATTVTVLAATDRLCYHQPAPLRMLALIAVLFLCMKGIVLFEAKLDGKTTLTSWRRIAFICGWFGMRPDVFARRSRASLPHGLRLIVTGVISAIAGLIVIRFASLGGHVLPRPMAICFLFVGCSLILHFGILNICAGFWRLLGFDCRALFRTPWQASSLADFWGRRWNVAFSEMISIAVVRPLTRSIGPRGARLAGFLVSGLLHEVAITVPVRAGYGLPTLYFLLQAVLTDWELRTKQRSLLRRAITVAAVLLPAPLVFPTAFVDKIVWPITATSTHLSTAW